MALWKGSLPAFLISLPYSTVLFASYHVLRPAVSPGHIDALTAAKIFGAGCSSGVLLTLFHGPLEVWKVRLQTTYTPGAASGGSARLTGRGEPTIAHELMDARARHGVQSLFRGSSMLLIRNVPGNGIFFSAFEGLGAMFRRNRNWGLDPFTAQLCVGGENFCSNLRVRTSVYSHPRCPKTPFSEPAAPFFH